jgi:hypothetical protein
MQESLFSNGRLFSRCSILRYHRLIILGLMKNKVSAFAGMTAAERARREKKWEQ